MAWYKVDDQLHSHPKARRAGLEAMGLWTLAGSHCMSYLTDGFVEEWFIDSWPHGRDLASRLVAVGLWLVVDGGWQFHDWEKYQPTKVSVQSDRAAAAERKRRQRARGEDGRYESRESHAVTSAVTDGVSHAERSSTPSPSPSPSPSPDPLTTESVSLGSNRVREHETDSEEAREQAEASARLAAGRGLDLDRIVGLADERCGREIGSHDALRLAQHITDKSRVELKNPMAYVASAFTKSPLEVQQWIDREVVL